MYFETYKLIVKLKNINDLKWQYTSNQLAYKKFCSSIQIVQIAQMCNAALKPKQYKHKTYCNKNGRVEFIIPCTYAVNVCWATF